MNWISDVSLLFGQLQEISRLRDVGDLRSVMSEGVGELDVNHYDNWDGGTTYYTLTVRVPVHIYACLENDLEKIEEQILGRVKRLLREETNDFVDKVVIQPLPAHAARITLPSDCRYWATGHFRLFISHLSENKLSATKLKAALEPLGISAFVAHEDIKPTAEWQDEIERALFSMDALAAILSEGFEKSKWTDQEIGVALGRNVLVLPIRYGIDP